MQPIVVAFEVLRPAKGGLDAALMMIVVWMRLNSASRSVMEQISQAW